MRLSVKPLLYALLGGLLLLQPGAGMGLAKGTASEQAERALIQWLGGPVALCLPGGDDTPAGGQGDECHPCCPPVIARGPAIPPQAPCVPLPKTALFRYAASITRPEPAAPTLRGPQQPRAPPLVT